MSFCRLIKQSLFLVSDFFCGPFVLSIGSGIFLLSFQGISFDLKEAFSFIGYWWMWWFWLVNFPGLNGFFICVAFVWIKALPFCSVSKAFDSPFVFKISNLGWCFCGHFRIFWLKFYILLMDAGSAHWDYNPAVWYWRVLANETNRKGKEKNCCFLLRALFDKKHRRIY